MDLEHTLTKCVLIVQLEIPKIPNNLFGISEIFVLASDNILRVLTRKVGTDP